MDVDLKKPRFGYAGIDVSNATHNGRYPMDGFGERWWFL
jgi:hypothetical protein